MNATTEEPQTNSAPATTLPPIRQQAKDYKKLGLGYLDELPRFTGIPISEVQRPGYSVETCAEYVARFAAIKKKCTYICAARVSGTPEWDLKAALARWLWEDATHFSNFEMRLTELRSNKFVVDKVLDYQLGDFLNEILQAPGSLALCVGLFDVLTPALCDSVRDYLAHTNSLADAPTVRLLRHMLTEEEERLTLGRQFVDALVKQPGGEKIRADWKQHFQTFLTAAKGILGREALPANFPQPVPRIKHDYQAAHEFARDERYTVYVPKMPPEELKAKRVQLAMWNRFQEMPVAETVAAIVYEWEDLPTEALVDLARHCWDEMRHTLFGDVALEAEGLSEQKFKNSWVGFGAHALSESPQKAYAHLALAIEAGLMAYPGGKRGEWEMARDSGHPLMTTFQDFDWADEVTHVKYGRKWLIEHHFKGNREGARKVADETIKDRVEFYAKYGHQDWMASRLK